MDTCPGSHLPDLLEQPPSRTTDWKRVVARYQQPALLRALWQITNTIVPYAFLWYLMHLTLGISYWLTGVIAVLAGGFLVRVFIIFHDCGHGSFFKSRIANTVCGSVTGVLTFTPYHHWRWEHAIHHSSAGDLDRRGTGDVWTLTVREYMEASRAKRLAYRLVRNPLVLFVFAPLFLFLVMQRIPSSKAAARERHSVHWTSLAVGTVACGMVWIFGLKAYFVLQLVILTVAGSTGVWLFYVQHQFEGVYWEGGEKWDYTAAALQGSSFYKLPRILQWFSGNIGFHHVHHLSPRIPNYNLEQCHNSDPLFRNVEPVTLFSSLKSFSFRLWDEQQRKLVSFAYLKTIRRDGGLNASR